MLAARNPEGETLAEGMRRIGARPEALDRPLRSAGGTARSEEHTSELQSPCISYAVFCLKKQFHLRMEDLHVEVALAVDLAAAAIGQPQQRVDAPHLVVEHPHHEPSRQQLRETNALWHRSA